MINESDKFSWAIIQETLVQHFISPQRLSTIRDIFTLPNFFEGWFTVESLSALIRRFSNIALVSNEHFLSFSKPDIAFSYNDLTCVIEVKHLSTRDPDCRGRWNGAKQSTVAKDICALCTNQNSTVVKRVLVFYGPAYQVNHLTSESCGRNHRKQCLECSIADLQKTVLEDCDFQLSKPECAELLRSEQGNFYLLIFTV